MSPTAEPAQSPLISVIVPSYNRLRYLQAAVDSVLAQSCRDFELIVADDGSEHDTVRYLGQIATLPQVVVLRLVHAGNPSIVRNAALRIARGRYVAFLDSDDLWLPTKLEEQLALHGRRAQCRWSYVAMERMHEDGTLMQGEPRRAVPEGAIFPALLTLTADVSMSAVMAERAMIEELGGFDEAQRFFEDFDFFLRLSLRSLVCVLPQPLVRMRSHGEHYSGDRVAMHEGRAQLLLKMQPFAEPLGLGSLVVREQLRNGADLARAYAALGRRREALGLLWRIRSRGWRERRWRAGVVAVAKSLAPGWVRAAYRRLQPRPV